MSFSIDANVLLYASDKSSPKHKAAIEFMENRISDPELFCVSWLTIMSYLRISTHSGIFTNPLTPDTALGNIESLLKLPQVKAISEEEGFLAVYRDVTGSFPVRGNLVPDAHLASILLQHGIKKIYTADRDFLKFDFLDVLDPFV
jgi:toxin-antitoxin system PIN domain toxin